MLVLQWVITYMYVHIYMCCCDTAHTVCAAVGDRLRVCIRVLLWHCTYSMCCSGWSPACMYTCVVVTLHIQYVLQWEIAPSGALWCEIGTWWIMLWYRHFWSIVVGDRHPWCIVVGDRHPRCIVVGDRYPCCTVVGDRHFWGVEVALGNLPKLNESKITIPVIYEK